MSFSRFSSASAPSASAGAPRQEITLLSTVECRYGIDLAALGDVLCQLGQVPRIEELGQAGPLLASAGPGSLFHCLFGRDAIRMAFDLLDDFPAVARTTVLALAGLQGVRIDSRAEEEPGRIVHEHRLADDALLPELQQVWSFPYYGAVDATPQWINLLTAYTARHGDAILDAQVIDRLDGTVTVFDALLAAVRWIAGRLDAPDGGGYLWVRRASPDGIANQVWEDSSDSYYDKDGTIFDFSHPYAPVAVQGYAYDALLGAAEMIERRSEASGVRRQEDAELARIEGRWAVELRARAADLRARFVREFWQPDLGTFALALRFEAPTGGDALRPRPARVIASSPGHLLAGRILDGDDVAPLRERLVRRLIQDDMLAGAGIRTRSTRSPRFRPGAYHNGSTWPMDTGIIADGLRRHGHEALADELEARILAGCAAVGGFPEFFRGDEDGRIAINTTTIDEMVDGVLNRLEQPPQPDQGWTVTRVWRILHRT